MSAHRSYSEKVMEIFTRHSQYAAHALAEFNAAQTQLELERVIDIVQLLAPEFRAVAEQKVATLERLLQGYKELYSGFIVSMNREMVNATALLPEAERTSEISRLARTTQERIDEQAEFYAARERWISAVRALSRLVAANVESIFVEEGELLCSDDEALDQISRVQHELQSCARIEQQIVQARVARISAGLGMLGARSR